MPIFLFRGARALGELEEEVEKHRREIDGLRYDITELKQRLQRAQWRLEKAEKEKPDYDAGPEAAVPAGGDRPDIDPVSRRLLARRRRGRQPPSVDTKNGEE